jgi:hypothetical protein
MAVYGEMVLAFPELLKTYEVFNMRPRIGAGYGERRNRRNVRGYWSWRKQSKMDVEGDLRTPNHQATFWVQDNFLGKKVAMGQNDHVEVDGKMFVTIDDQNFSHEGGFYKCLMQRLAGVTDQQTSNKKVDETIKGDY